MRIASAATCSADSIDERQNIRMNSRVLSSSKKSQDNILKMLSFFWGGIKAAKNALSKGGYAVKVQNSVEADEKERESKAVTSEKKI